MSDALLLTLALSALMIGPVLYGLARQVRWTFAAIDGFVLTAVGALVLLQVGPRAVAEGGGGAVGAFALGLAGPVVLGKLRVEWSRAQRWMVGLGITGLVAHGALDGAAIASGRIDLASAVIVHRIPAGIFVWWLVRPSQGQRRAWLVLGALAATTCVGFGIGQGLHALEGSGLAVFESFVAGALVHVLIGHGPELHGHHPGAHSRVAELCGTGLAAVAYALLPEAPGHHPPAASEYGERFMTLVFEAAPALLLGYTLAGLFAGFLSQRAGAWMGGGSAWSQAARGVAFGAPIPVCSCGVLPVYEGLARRATPAAAGLAFLVATPELGIESVLLSVPMLGMQLSLIRVGAAVAIAFAVGVLMGRKLGSPAPSSAPEPEGPTPSLGGRLREAAQFGYRELVDHTMGWILLGIAVAALFDAESLTWLAEVPAPLQVLLFAGLSIPMYVCASGATPLAAALVSAGASPGGALAFLLAGPATNITTFGVLRRLHGGRAALAFGGLVLAGAVATGLAVDLMGVRPDLSRLSPGGAEPGWLAWASTLILAGLTLGSLYRLGPRHLLMTVLRPMASHEPHEEPCGHDPHSEHEPAWR
jgi:hypothetical protein